MHRLVVSHVEAVVASDHDPLGTHLANHELHDGFRVDNSVKRKTLQILAWDLRQIQFLYFRPHLRAVVNPSHQHKQHAPAVGQSDLKLGVAVQDAAEYKVADRDGRVERKTQDVRQIERRSARAANDLQRMQENGKIQRLDVGKYRLEQRVVEVAMVDVCAHVNASHSRQLAGAIQFIDRAIREEHWKRQESE